jgi:hypothetical protein
MATRSRGPSAAFGWLNRGIGIGFRHPKPLFGDVVVLALVALIPAFITLPMQFFALRSGTPLPTTVISWIAVASMLLGLLVMPLYAGYLQVNAAAELGFPARASDIFRPYREGKALRVIGYGIAMMMVYFTMLAIMLALTGTGIVHWYVQVVNAQANHQLPPTTLPDGFGTALLLFAVLGIFIMGFYSISLGQVVLGDRSVFGAIGDGIIGTFKNLLPLLVLAVCLLLLWIAAGLCFGIVAMLLALIGKLITPWLVVVLIIPLYIALLLVSFTAGFGVMYHLWRDVCGDDMVKGTAEAIAA